MENLDLEQMAEEDGAVEGAVEETVETNGELVMEDDLDAAVEDAADPTDEETSAEEASTDGDTEEAAPARLDFEARAEAMGLTPLGAEGCFHYADEFSEVVYRLLQTGSGAGLVDDVQVPPVGLFTKPAGIDGEFGWVGIVSMYYKFEGNGALIGRIRESVAAVGNPIMSENTVMAPNLASIRHDIVIQHATNVPAVGDMYPVLIVTNSYDGTKAANVAFGLSFNDGEQDIRFCSHKKLGSLRQIHLEGADTTMQAEVGGYITAFAGNIGDMIQANMESTITEDDMMSVLDMIEKQTGKTRREAISAVITEAHPTEGIESWTMTSWQLFNAITKFSSLEANLNSKKILESVAERVLIIPAQMVEAVAALRTAE